MNFVYRHDKRFDFSIRFSTNAYMFFMDFLRHQIKFPNMNCRLLDLASSLYTEYNISVMIELYEIYFI